VILAGDVGGTNTRLGLFDDQKKLRLSQVYQSRLHESLEEIIAAFLAAHPVQVDAACIGVAGPVRDNHAVVSNLPWAVGALALANRFSFPQSIVINDLEATAWGIPSLTSNDFEVLNPGKAATGTAAVICSGHRAGPGRPVLERSRTRAHAE